MALTIVHRDIKGKKVKKLRKEGYVPGVIYGGSLDKNIDIAVEKIPFLKEYEKAGSSTPIVLKDEQGNEWWVLVRDLQKDPVKDALIHVDFQVVVRDEEVEAEVPVVLVGESEVEKNKVGQIEQLMQTIRVSAFPQDLPHDIKIDLSKIKTVNDVIFVKDLDLGEKVKILEDPEAPIVTVVELQEEVEEEAPAAEEEAAAAASEETQQSE